MDSVRQSRFLDKNDKIQHVLERRRRAIMPESKRKLSKGKKKSLAAGLGNKRLAPELISGVLQKESINWKKTCLLSGLIALTVFASYAFTIWFQYVYCDMFNLSPLRVVEDWFWSNLLTDLFTTPLSQPLVRATLAIDMQSATIMSPAVFHCVNILIHLANCILLYCLVYQLTNQYNKLNKEDADPYVVGACSAILFACHPLTCESVAYISARSALLVTFNYLAALLFFLRGFLAKEITQGVIGYALCYFFICCAIWSGPQGLTAAGAMLVLAMLLKTKKESWKTWVMDRPLEIFSIVLVATVVPWVLLLKYTAPIGNGFGLASLPPAAYIATQCKALLTYYLRVAVVPLGLSLDPPYAFASNFADPLAILGALVPFVFLGLAWRYRNSLLVGFSCAFFVLALLPDFVLVQPEVFSDRRFYLPLLALCIPAGLFVFRMAEKRLMATIGAGVLLVCGLIGLTNWRSIGWQNDFQLWQGAEAMNKASERSQVMLVWSQFKAGQLEQANEKAKAAIKQYPDSAILNMVLGKYANAMKDYKEAQKYFQKAADLAEKQNLSPEIVWDLKYGLAYSYLYTGDLKKAYDLADAAIRFQPNNSTLHLIKGKYYLSVDQPQAAFLELQKAYILDRYNPSVLEPLARAAIGCGTKEHQDVGYEIAKRAYRVTDDPQMLVLQAYGAVETGHIHDVFKYLSMYLKFNKPTAEVYYILYGAYKKLNLKAESDMSLQIALKEDPDIRKKMRLYLNRPLVKPEPSSKGEEGNVIPVPKEGTTTQAQSTSGKRPTAEQIKDAALKIPFAKRTIMPADAVPTPANGAPAPAKTAPAPANSAAPAPVKTAPTSTH